VTGRLEVALVAAVARDRVEEKVRAAAGAKALHEGDANTWLAAKLITPDEAATLNGAKKLIRDAIMVDDFAPDALAREQAPDNSKRTGSAAA
jgi:hypothetical protein